MSHRVDPGFGGERALGDKCALPSSLYTGVRYKPLLTGGMALLAGGAMPLAFAPVGWAWLAVIALATFFVLTAQSSRGRLRKRKIKHAKPVAAAVAA